MKIAISSTGQKINDKIDDVFARCPYFIIVEIKDDKIEKTESLKNESVEQIGGAGISTAKLMAEKGVEAVVAGNVGPRASEVLAQFNIKVYQASGTVEQAIQDFIDNKFEEVKK